MPIIKSLSPRDCRLIGHRGAMGHAPENTMASFRYGLKVGADFVECDVHLSKDNRCIVMHNAGVDKTTSGSGPIRDLTLREIKRLDAGAWFSKKFRGEKVPTLNELLQWAGKKNSLSGLPLGVVIEIKNESVRYTGIEKKVLQTVIKNGMRKRVIIISFNHETVRKIKKIDSQILTGILYSRPLRDPCGKAGQVKAEMIFPRRQLVTKSLVKKAHRKDLAVATWTVNETKEMSKMINCGVDMIATNFPEKLNRLLNNRTIKSC